jgi:endonuclease YncB( thermonuclease family)
MGGNVAVIGRRLRDVLVGCGMLFLALLIIAKLETQQTIRWSGPFTVIDGDTLSDHGKRLRLRGMDAPELGQICEGSGGPYDCGMVARESLVRLSQNGYVECFGSGGEQDRFGRILVTCRSGDDDLGQQMVSLGIAVADGDYHLAEVEARRAHRGIWAGLFERPEDWRRRQRLEEREPGGWLQTLLSRVLGWEEAE